MNILRRGATGVVETLAGITIIVGAGHEAYSHHNTADELRGATPDHHVLALGGIGKAIDASTNFVDRVVSVPGDIGMEYHAATGDLQSTIAVNGKKHPATHAQQEKINNELEGTFLWSILTYAGVIAAAAGTVTIWKRPKVAE